MHTMKTTKTKLTLGEKIVGYSVFASVSLFILVSAGVAYLKASIDSELQKNSK